MIYFLKPEWYIFAYVLWWINVALSLLAGWGITFVVFGINRFKEKEVNATILLPAVTMTVVASTGSLISESFMDHPSWQLSSDIVTFLLWANAVALSVFLIGSYFQKLLIHGLPPKSAIYTCFIPIGILGQGGWAIQLNYRDLGQLIVSLGGFKLVNMDIELSPESLQLINAMLNFTALSVALFLASFGVCLTVVSIMSVIYHGRPPLWTRNMWASTFPLGTMALSFNQMYITTGLKGFLVIGTIYSVMLVLMTTYCMIGTALFEIPHKQIWKALKGLESTTNSYDV
ncbi:DEKNAAC104687 [Brettanomyces naardenensis]|uniref:DEKNAAC104687 n=1 Tax=Brettanomyces naardenensis TaxID=13370 RepID=A0A448YR01_BRENA|nr:DEKNAAC104687 [Brettanomyces naardenensis]